MRCNRLLLPLLLLAAFGCAGQPPRPPAENPPAAPQIDPKLTALFAEGLDHLRAERYQPALEAFQALTAAAPQLPGPWTNLGLAYAAVGKEAEAFAALEQALSIQPNHPVAANQLAILQRKAGRFQEARATYEALLAAHPEYALAYLNLGVLCDLYLQDLPCALQAFERFQALQSEPDAEVEKWLIDVKRRAGVQE